MWLRAITKANLKSGIKMKVVRNTCDKELGGEMKSVSEKKLLQKFTWNLTKVSPF